MKCVSINIDADGNFSKESFYIDSTIHKVITDLRFLAKKYGDPILEMRVADVYEVAGAHGGSMLRNQSGWIKVPCVDDIK